MGDDGEKIGKSQVSFERFKPGSLPKYLAGNWHTTRAKCKKMKPTDDCTTSWNCHSKKRYLGDTLSSKLILQIGF